MLRKFLICGFAQNFSHGLTLGEFVDKLVHISDFPHGLVLDFFHPAEKLTALARLVGGGV